jgi:putative transposase
VTALVMQAAKGRLYGGSLNGPLAAIARIGGQTRAIWNHFLGQTIARYEAEQKFVFYAEMSAALPKLLKSDPRLTGCPHRAAQMTVQKLDRALRECGKKVTGRKGFPKFKRYTDHADAFSFVGRECRFEPARIRLPKIGWVRVRGLVLSDDADVKQVAVTQEPRGWHVSVQFEAAPKIYVEPTQPVVGIDHGLTTLAALGIGDEVPPPRFARKAEKHVRRLNRERDRRRKGSVNRRRTVARLAKAHRYVRQQRHDFLHKLTRVMVDTFEGFAVEDLNLKGLMKTRLAKSFADASLGELLRMLSYKAEWACREWRVIGRFQRSTGVCSDCGWIGPRLRLGIEEWTCGDCGVVHDRDIAAGRVILRDATVVRAAGVAPVRREPASVMGRKRASVVRGGERALSRSSHGEPASNVAVTEAIS